MYEVCTQGCVSQLHRVHLTLLPGWLFATALVELTTGPCMAWLAVLGVRVKWLGPEVGKGLASRVGRLWGSGEGPHTMSCPGPCIQDNASKLLLALMESRHDSENAERILISLRPQELVSWAGAWVCPRGH